MARNVSIGRILVTGGAGFVGSHLALGLKAAGAQRVVAFDNLKRRGAELNLHRLREGGVEFVHGDIRQPADLEAAGPADVILECSAEPSVLAGYGESPAYVVDTNLTGALHCFEYARRHEAAVLFLSTSRVYPMQTLRDLDYEETETRFELTDNQTVPGASPEGIAEDFPLAGVRSLYGATKLAAETMLAEFLDMYGLPGVINRCGIITGPWQMGKVDQGVVVLWAARHVYQRPLSYIGYGGTGKQVRDLLHAEDLFRLVHYQLENMDALSGRTFNVGGGREVSASLLELTALCQEITGAPIEVRREPEDRPADIPLYLSDTARVTEATGWTPQHSVFDTVEDICRWIWDHKEALRPILS